MRRLAISFLAALLAGCVVGPNYQRPVVEPPAAFRYAMADARDTTNSAWWTQFGDPVLDGLIDEALAHNLDVKIAAANVEQAAAMLTQARSSLYPQASASGNLGGARESARVGSVYSYQALAGASWELDLWGRVKRLIEVVCV